MITASTGRLGPRPLTLLCSITLGLLLVACDSSSPTAPAPNPGTQLSGIVPDFALVDVNPTSPTSGRTVAVRDYLGWVSAWYFGAAT